MVNTKTEVSNSAHLSEIMSLKTSTYIWFASSMCFVCTGKSGTYCSFDYTDTSTYTSH